MRKTCMDHTCSCGFSIHFFYAVIDWPPYSFAPLSPTHLQPCDPPVNHQQISFHFRHTNHGFSAKEKTQ